LHFSFSRSSRRSLTSPAAVLRAPGCHLEILLLRKSIFYQLQSQITQNLNQKSKKCVGEMKNFEFGFVQVLVVFVSTVNLFSIPDYADFSSQVTIKFKVRFIFRAFSTCVCVCVCAIKNKTKNNGKFP
jgi:hypothetical protein